MTTAPQTQPNVVVSTKRRLRRWPFVIALPLLIGGAWAYLDSLCKPKLETGPMVQLPAPGRAAIVWQARVLSGDQAEIRAGPSERLEPGQAQLNTAGYFVGTLDTGDRREFFYETANRGLLGRLITTARGSVRLPPPPGLSFRFLAFGDSGNGSRTQRIVAETMIQKQPDLIIHLGDLIYPNGAVCDYKRNFFEPYRELLASVPFMPCLGNHDVATDKGQPFLDAFVLPENGPDGIQPERNFWFDFGDARFVALDTNLDTKAGAISEADMRDKVAPWLRDVLKSSDRHWKFVYFHHPPYTGGMHTADRWRFVHDCFVPVFDECRVDMVFSGHNHLYERTKPLRREKIVPPGDGTIYIVSGAGGVSRYAERVPSPPYIEKFNNDVFSFTQVDLAPTKLELTQIDAQGNVIDSLTIDKTTATTAPTN